MKNTAKPLASPLLVWIRCNIQRTQQKIHMDKKAGVLLSHRRSKICVSFIIAGGENDPRESPLPICPNRAAFHHYSAQRHALTPFQVSQSIKASLFGDRGSLMARADSVWTESPRVNRRSFDAHRAHPRSRLHLHAGDKGAMHMLILRPKTDWSHSTQIPAEERHYYLCSGAQWHISKRRCGGRAKSLGVCACLWLSLLMTAPSQWQFRKKRWSV